MTRKDYCKLAAVIYYARLQGAVSTRDPLDVLTDMLSIVLKEDNAAFNAERFSAATREQS